MTTGEETTIKTIETKNVNSIVDDEPLPIIDNTTKDIEAANINEKVIDMTDIKSSEGVVGAGGGGEKESNWRADQVHVLPTNNLPLVFSGLMLATFLAALDQTIVATSLPSIIRELGDGSPAAYSAYSWIGVAYLLTATAFSPFYGKLSVVFGRKPLLYFSIVCFLVGSALCGASKTILMLCISRGVQGIGGGGILQLTQIVISDIVPLATRGKWSGTLGSVWGLASILGPLIGGILTDKVSWRWIFYVNLPTGGLAFAILFFSLKLNPHKTATLKSIASTFDFLGLFLILVGVVCLLVGFNNGQSSWGSAETIALLVVGVLSLAAAGYVEMVTKKSAIIPPRLFKTRTTTCILLLVYCHAFGFIAGSYYLPLYFQVRGANALLSGVELMPFSLGAAVSSVASGFLLAKTKKYKMIITVSFALCTLGFALLATWDENSSEAQKVIYLLIAAAGVGPIFQVPLVALQASMPIADMATSTATYGFIRSLGGTTSISIGGAIYASELQRRLAGISNYVPLNDNIASISQILPYQLRQQVEHAYTRSISTIWIVAAPLMFIAFILSLFLRHYSLDRSIVRTGEVVKKVEEGSKAAELGVVGEDNKQLESTPSSTSEETLADEAKVETKEEAAHVVVEQK